MKPTAGPRLGAAAQELRPVQDRGGQGEGEGGGGGGGQEAQRGGRRGEGRARALLGGRGAARRASHVSLVFLSHCYLFIYKSFGLCDNNVQLMTLTVTRIMSLVLISNVTQFLK